MVLNVSGNQATDSLWPCSLSSSYGTTRGLHNLTLYLIRLFMRKRECMIDVVQIPRPRIRPMVFVYCIRMRLAVHVRARTGLSSLHVQIDRLLTAFAFYY